VRKLPVFTAPSVASAAPTPAAPVPSDPAPPTTPPIALPKAPRPIVRASAPERYRVQFTISPETHERFRRLQALLRREIPDGDPGKIFDRAVALLLQSVERTKLGVAARPRTARSIRPRTDNPSEDRLPSRHIPQAVKRGTWPRDAGQCAFVSTSGRRCSERAFLEFHHVQPHARQGPATVENISLRCWRHNQYEAQLIFGPYRAERNQEPDG
jgi:5-methylcytosine-specific restriction endonuclease McrA